VKWCLRNEAVRERDTKEAGDASGNAQKEDIPMKPCWFSEGKFGSLSYQGGDWEALVVVTFLKTGEFTVVIEPKQNRK